jgi:hypothetical protein
MGSDIINKNTRVGVAIVSVSCCFPGIAAFEKQAQRIVEQAISEAGVNAVLQVLPVSAYSNSIPREVIPRLTADYNQGKISAPAILIDGKAVFYGVPGLDEMKKALVQAAEARKMKEGTTSEPETKSSSIA